MTRSERLALNKLSLEAFGSSSRWQKILKGRLSLLVYQDEQGNEQPQLVNGSRQWLLEHPSVDELIVYMQNTIDAKRRMLSVDPIQVNKD